MAEKAVILLSFSLGLLLLWRMADRSSFRWGEGEKNIRWPSYRLLIIPACLILLYGLFMSVPLPSSVHQLLSPGSLEFFARTDRAAGMTANHPLSLYPMATVEALLKLAAVMVFFLVCLSGLSSWKKVRRTTFVLITAAFVISLLAVTEKLTGNRIFLAGRVISENAEPFGPFVNRNHFAGWGAMAAMAGIGYLFSLEHRRYRKPSSEEGGGPFGANARDNRDLWARQILVGFMTAVVVSAVFLSLSRGGVISFFSGLVVFCFLLGTKGKLRWGWGILAVVFLALILVFWLGADPVVERLSTVIDLERSAMVRINLNRDLLVMANDFIWVGSGPGTFASIYPAYQQSGGLWHFTYGHNDYLQLFVEWGLAGTTLFLTAGAFFLWTFFRLWRARRDKEGLYMAAGAAGGMASMMVHSLVDFNLHIISNALTAMFLGALALRAVVPRGASHHRGMADAG